jgi:hypothetical protein
MCAQAMGEDVDGQSLDEAFAALYERSSPEERDLFFEGQMALMKSMLCMVGFGIAMAAGTTQEQFDKRFELATLFLLERTWDDELTEDDLEFARALAAGEETWR